MRAACYANERVNLDLKTGARRRRDHRGDCQPRETQRHQQGKRQNFKIGSKHSAFSSLGSERVFPLTAGHQGRRKCLPEEFGSQQIEDAETCLNKLNDTNKEFVY